MGRQADTQFFGMMPLMNMAAILRGRLARGCADAVRPGTMAMLFCCQAGLCVLMLAVLVPPFENSDEFNHMNRVDQIAGGGLIATRYGGPGTSGGRADLGIDRIDAIIAPLRFHPERKVTLAMLRQAGAIGWGERARITFPNTSIYAPLLYLPAAIGLFTGKHLGFSIVHTLMMTRAASGLASIATAGLAIALAGEAAPLLLVLLCLPMSLSLFAAVSQDGPMLAVAALAMALAARMRVIAPHRSRTAMIALCVALALLGIGRPAYAPLAILPLLLPSYSWARRRAATLWVLGSIGAWSAIVACFTMINADAFRGVNPRAQLFGLLAHPGRVPALAWRAMTDRQGMEGQPFYREFIGVLGWIDVVLPGWFYGLAIAVLALAAFAQMLRPVTVLSVRAKFALGAAMLLAAATLFGLEYLTFTPVAFPWVEGVQGRYFLPIAMFVPLLLPALRNGMLARLALPLQVMVLLFPAMSVAVTIISVVRRYYV